VAAQGKDKKGKFGGFFNKKKGTKTDGSTNSQGNYTNTSGNK